MYVMSTTRPPSGPSVRAADVLGFYLGGLVRFVSSWPNFHSSHSAAGCCRRPDRPGSRHVARGPDLVARGSRQNELVSSSGILGYHETSKHSPESVRRSSRGLDWANKPYPYKDYAPGLPTIGLPMPEGPASGR